MSFGTLVIVFFIASFVVFALLQSWDDNSSEDRAGEGAFIYFFFLLAGVITLLAVAGIF